MNRASANASAEATAGRSAGFGQPGADTDRWVGLPPQGPSQIPGDYSSAAEAWDPARTPAQSSPDFMSAGIREQADLLEGIAAINASQETVAPVDAAGSSNSTSDATYAEPGINIKWVFNKRNFRKLLKKCFHRGEELESARWTIKGYMEGDTQSTARTWDLEAINRDLQARNRVLEATVDDLNDERQTSRDARMNLEDMHQLYAEELRRKDDLISSLLDRLTGRGL
jgi:hypothetical protein